MSAKIDVTQKIMTLDNEPARLNGDVLTYRDAFITALLNPPGGKQVDGKESLLRFKLAQRISQEEQVGLSSKEVIFLLEAITGVFGPLVYGRCYIALEGDDDPSK